MIGGALKTKDFSTYLFCAYTLFIQCVRRITPQDAAGI